MSFLPPKQSVDSGDLNYSPSGDAVYNFVSSTTSNLGAVTKEPTGFVDRTASSVSFSDISRTFSIQPVSGSYDFYIKGTKFTKSGIDSVTIPNLDGANYIYFDASGNLTSTQSFTISLITDYALVSIVYWNTSTSSRVYWAEERHGLTMDGSTHSYLHTVFGARFISGFALQNFSVDGTGNSDAHAQFTSDSGSIRDEDILIQAPAELQIPILYKINTIWYKKAADSYPVIYSGTAGFTGANNLLAYNELVAGNWQLTEVPNNQFVLVHFFATNDLDNPIVGIQGINTYGSISGARNGANAEISSLSGLPFAEFVPVGSVIFQTASSYLNTPKARVRSTDLGGNYVDFRGTQLYTPAAGNATSHSLLSNLTNDDHLQYLLVSGARPMTSALDMGTNKINNVVDPSSLQDAATKNYVDTGLSGKQSTGNYITALTGDVTASGPGSASATIANNSVTNAKLDQIATATFKGRITAGLGNVEDLNATQATSLLNIFGADLGSGGLKGLVPATQSGDATKFLRGDATWATVDLSNLANRNLSNLSAPTALNAALLTQNGTVSAPSYSFTNLTNSGLWYDSATNSLKISYNGTTQLTIGAATITARDILSCATFGATTATIYSLSAGGITLSNTNAYGVVMYADTVGSVLYPRSIGRAFAGSLQRMPSLDVWHAVRIGKLIDSQTTYGGTLMVRQPDSLNMGGVTASPNASTTFTLNIPSGGYSPYNFINIGDYIQLNGLPTIAKVISFNAGTYTVDTPLGDGTARSVIQSQNIASFRKNDATEVLSIDKNGLTTISGGLNLSTLTASTMLASDASKNVVSFANGSEGQVLKIVSGVPAWAADAAGMSNPMTTQGDIIVGGVSGAPSRLGIGSNNQFLKSNGTTTVWSSILTATPVVQTATNLTDAVNISVDASLGNIFRVTLGDNRTLSNPTNATDGQMLQFEIRQDGTGGRTLAFDTKFRFSIDLPQPTLSTGANKLDRILFIYNLADDKFDCLAINKGF